MSHQNYSASVLAINTFSNATVSAKRFGEEAFINGSFSARRENEVIPIFYAVDDCFIKYMIVSIQSLIENAAKSRRYIIYVLNSGISSEMKAETEKLKQENVDIRFVDVKRHLEMVAEHLPIRDYYSKTTYYRLFIPSMFPEYKKAIYIDSDTVVLGDISRLYDTQLKDNLVGACPDQATAKTDIFGEYVEKVLGVDRNKYFNAGMLLLNCEQFRKNNLLEKFMETLKAYTFVVAQDQDYLNVLCKDKILWLDKGWNVEVYGEIPVQKDEIKIIHYIMVSKPWHYADCRMKEYFWAYADKTSVKEQIYAELDAYTDELKERDARSCGRLIETAKKEIAREDNYLKTVSSGKSVERLKVQEKIRVYEREGKFDQDVEEDPPTKELLPDKVDYLHKKLSTRIKTRIANAIGDRYFKNLLKDGTMVVDGVVGKEYLSALENGAVITCNHFSFMDNYILFHCIRDSLPRKLLYKIIREGNYTNFPGLFGFLMRYCNTLPLSSNRRTMINFLSATDALLKRGESILIYPEQAMWWNYKKPRPFKVGGFKIAYRAGVPVLPTFISMQDDPTRLDKDGYPVQRHTLHIMPPIYPDKTLGEKLGAKALMDAAFLATKECYEKAYGIPLEYTFDK